jgi:hypothetical protein
MTIYLPDNTSEFRQALNETCDRILRSEYDETFFALMVDFIVALKGHPFTKTYFNNFENEYSKWRQEYIEIASNILEYNWKKLWQYHRRRFKFHSQLINIRRILTTPRTMEFSPLYPRALINMRLFRNTSPFFRCIIEAPFLFSAAQNQINLWPLLGKRFSSGKNENVKQRKAALVKLEKKNKTYLIFRIKQKISISCSLSKQLNRSVERISELFSPQEPTLEKKFGIPGCNNDEKQRNMIVRAETLPFFCLERFRFLEQCLNSPNNLPPTQPIAKRKKEINQEMWIAAFERCEKEALWYAKKAFLQRNTPNHHMNAFVSYDYDIRRRDFEKYLIALKNYIHAYLYQIDKPEQKSDDDLNFALPGTLKGNFVIKLGQDFWKNCPLGKRDDAFEYYQCTCPFNQQLKRDRWDQIIRDHKVDPRSKKDQVRSCGKKTCKK